MRDPQLESFELIDKLAVFLDCDETKSGHTGFAYIFGDEGVRVCHLLSHNLFRIESPSQDHQDYFWEDARFDDDEKDLIIGYCESVKSANGSKVPYGFNHEGVELDRYGNIKVVTKDGGLTCATLVMKIIYYAAGVNILDVNNWRATISGTEKQRKIVDTFIEYKDRYTEFTDSYIENVSSGIGLPRVSPEHVVAGCLSDQRPLGYEEADARGKTLTSSVIISKSDRGQTGNSA